MEHPRRTQEEPESVQEQLRRREPIFHHPEFGTSRADFEAMTSEEFREVGASGNIYSREFVIETLLERFSRPHHDDFAVSDFRCRKVDVSTYLVTYSLLQGDLTTRRATLWKRDADRWVILYHQGTEFQSDDRDPRPQARPARS